MKVNLNAEEKQYMEEVLNELRPYKIKSNEQRKIREQIIEHFEESRENDHDGISQLGDVETFVKDYLEINGIDLHTEITKMRRAKSRKGILVAIGICTSLISYFISHILLSMFLTESFNPLNYKGQHDQDIYEVSNIWWDSMLFFISISISLVVTVLTVLYTKKRINWI
jgi:hypothetical protein